MKKLFTLIMVVLFLPFGFSQNYVWQLKRSGSSLGGPIDVEKYHHDNVYYGSLNKIFKSTDRGETFTQIGTNVPSASEIKCVFIDDDNPDVILVGIEASTDKIVKTTDAGATWTITADGLSFSYFGIPITQDPTHPDTFYTMNGNNFMRSTDFGSTWTTISSSFGTNSAPCDIEVFPDTSIVLVGDNGTGIFRSKNYGLTWTQTYSTSGEIPTIAVDFTHPGIAYATKWAGGGGLLKSTDYGATWSLMTGFTGQNMWGVHTNPFDGNEVYAGCYSCGLSWKTKNGGATWQTVSIPSVNYQYFIVDSMNVFAAQGNGFYKLDSPFFIPVELTAFSAELQDENIILNWTTATELNNSGFEIESSTDNVDFIKIGFVPGYGTTTQSKDYSFIISETYSYKTYYRLKQIDFDGSYQYSSSVEVESVLPKKFSLEQNYPNPFNPNTTIKFELPKDGFVSLKIYDILGNEITTLVNEEKPTGRYEINFDASALVSGVYIYKLESAEYISTKKMLLLK
ncbi:MAG: T9SS type A sorting domain-containing protein [Ignavibacteriaceae bacterium]|jgi:photosystem II stability/assembly factor-like uncharacterized protein|nr:T9SS type A sorting domain-containing protein [Ignavibacteriaceae bacterium]